MLKLVQRLSVIAILPCIVAGCVVAPTLTPEQQASEAIVVAAISPLRSGCPAPGILDVDGRPTSLFAGATIAMTAGVHTLRTTYNVSGTLTCLPSEPLVFPAFNYQAGHRYVLRGNTVSEDSQIDDTVLNDPAHAAIATYVLRNGQYLEKSAAIAQDGAEAQAVQQRAQDAQRAFLLQQQQDMPRIRKVGAEVCKHTDNGIAHGYVEGVADQKIKIRVDQVGDRSLSPQANPVIWEFPEPWYLCGTN